MALALVLYMHWSGHTNLCVLTVHINLIITEYVTRLWFEKQLSICRTCRLGIFTHVPAMIISVLNCIFLPVKTFTIINSVFKVPGCSSGMLLLKCCKEDQN